MEVSPDGFSRETRLDPWDSLAWVSTMALIDEVFGKSVSPGKLRDCVTAGDVLNLVAA